MRLTINGQDYDLKFTFRVIQKISTFLGFPKLQAGTEMMSAIGFDNAASLIGITIKENLRRAGTKAKTPSEDQILDAMDDDITLFGDFVTAFGEGYGAMFPDAEAEAKKIEAGE